MVKLRVVCMQREDQVTIKKQKMGTVLFNFFNQSILR